MDNPGVRTPGDGCAALDVHGVGCFPGVICWQSDGNDKEITALFVTCTFEYIIPPKVTALLGPNLKISGTSTNNNNV